MRRLIKFAILAVLYAGCAHEPTVINCGRVCNRAADGKGLPHVFAHHDEDERRCYCVPARGEVWTCPEAGCPELPPWPIHN